MSIAQVLGTFKMTTSSPPRSTTPVKSPTPLRTSQPKGLLGFTVSRSSTLQSGIYPLDTSQFSRGSHNPSDGSHSSQGSNMLPPIDFNPSINLETPQLHVHRASVSSTESSVTFTEPEDRRGSTDSRKEGRLRPPTPSPVLGGDGFQSSASSMGTLYTNSGTQNEMEKPRIIIGFHDEPVPGPKPILENGHESQNSQDGSEHESRVRDVVLVRQSGEQQRASRDSRASSGDRSTLVIPNLEDDGLGDVGSPRTGLKEFDSEGEGGQSRKSADNQGSSEATFIVYTLEPCRV